MKKMLTILVADDDATHREVLRTLLEEWGYAVREAVDGEHAVALCRKQPFDLVLMDVRMPKKSGLEALKEIKVHNPAVPVLIMTAFSEVAAAVEAIKSGAYDYLTKPLDFEKLKVVLRNVFAHVGLIRENATLSRSLAATEAQTGMVGRSESMRALWEMVRTIAPTDATVLITGESGTGKELFANAIHCTSQRKDKPFVAVNCAAIPRDLIGSELFGYVGGSFTGASRTGAKGKFELADGGTLFLDEIGEMPVEMQSVLLRALEDNCITRIGATKPINVDVRIITATNKDLTKCIADGTFRADLYYRLNVINLTMIPLRRRKEDIKELAEYFLERFAFENGKNIHSISTAAALAMGEYGWPGNVRELRNCMEYSVIVCKTDQIEREDLPQSISMLEKEEPVPEIEQDSSELRIMSNFFTKQRLEMAKKLMVEYKGNKSRVAKEMGVSRSTLYRILNAAENTQNEK